MTTTLVDCGGGGIDPDARIRSAHELLIEAPPEQVWRRQTEVGAWPSWQSAVRTAEWLTPGALAVGSRFRWETPVPETPVSPADTLVITSTVEALEPGRCIRWTGPGAGSVLRIERGVHVWTFTAVEGGTLVRTEESWAGAQVEADVAFATAALGASLEAWLSDLKAVAEHAGTV